MTKDMKECQIAIKYYKDKQKYVMMFLNQTKEMERDVFEDDTFMAYSNVWGRIRTMVDMLEKRKKELEES